MLFNRVGVFFVYVAVIPAPSISSTTSTSLVIVGASLLAPLIVIFMAYFPPHLMLLWLPLWWGDLNRGWSRLHVVCGVGHIICRLWLPRHFECCEATF